MKKLFVAGVIFFMAGTAWARSSTSSPMPFSQSDQPVKKLNKLVVCILGGFETKGKTAAECKALGGREAETPELTTATK